MRRARGEIVAVAAVYPPGNAGQPVEVVAADRVLRRMRLDQRELLHLLIDRFLRLGVELELAQTFFELLQFGGLPLLFQAEFLLDRLELLAQEELALLGRDLLLDAPGDLALQARDFELLLEQDQHHVDALAHIEGLEDALQLAAVGRGQVGGEVGQSAGVVHARAVEEELDLFRIERVDLHQFLEGGDDRHGVGLELRVHRQFRGKVIADPGGQHPPAGDHLLDNEALQAVDHDVDAVVVGVQDLENLGGDADGVQVLGAVLGIEVAHHDQADGPRGTLDGLAYCRHLLWAIGGQRDQQGRETGARAQRDDRQLVGQNLGGNDQSVRSLRRLVPFHRDFRLDDLVVRVVV